MSILYVYTLTVSLCVWQSFIKEFYYYYYISSFTTALLVDGSLLLLLRWLFDTTLTPEPVAAPGIFILGGVTARGSGGRKSPNGVQGRSSGMESGGTKSPRRWSSLNTWFTNCDCRNDKNVKILAHNITLCCKSKSSVLGSALASLLSLTVGQQCKCKRFRQIGHHFGQ